MPLRDLNALTSLNLDHHVQWITSSEPLLVSPPRALPCLAVAILEAAFLDRGLGYTRRISADLPQGPAVIFDDATSESNLKKEGDVLRIHPVQTEVLDTAAGHSRRGIIDEVVIAAGIAVRLSPNGHRTRGILPWALAGPWIRSDRIRRPSPLFSAVRDALVTSGLVRVVPLPEVQDADVCEGSKKIHQDVMDLADDWGILDLSTRADRISKAVASNLQNAADLAPRIEVLTWQRPIPLTGAQDQLTLIERWLSSFGSGMNASKEIDLLLNSVSK